MKQKASKAKRTARIWLNEFEHTDLELTKAASVDVDTFALHLDKLADGTYRLLYSPKIIPDFSKVKSIEFIREE